MSRLDVLKYLIFIKLSGKPGSVMFLHTMSVFCCNVKVHKSKLAWMCKTSVYYLAKEQGPLLPHLGEEDMEVFRMNNLALCDSLASKYYKIKSREHY